MNFASDNTAGVSAPVMAALQEANKGFASAYGTDELTAAAGRRLAELFECDAQVFLVATGTAANALSLAAIAQPWTAILCSHNAHVLTDECGAVEMYSGGARLVGQDGNRAKPDVAALADSLAAWPGGRPHVMQPAGVSISQATEWGAVWSPDEVGAVGEVARRHGLKLHMDGARFANAVAALNCAPAEITWRAGVDILSFGATKNGAMGAEAIVVFDPALAETLAKRRMRAGQLLSKSRFPAAQLLAYLENGHWLELAAHANEMAGRLARGLETRDLARLAVPAQANEVFAWVPEPAVKRLREAGAKFYEWPGRVTGADIAGREGERLVRLVTSFSTRAEEVDRFTDIAAGA